MDIASFDPDEIGNNPLSMPDSMAAAKARDYLEECLKNKDSCGGVVECRITGVPAGLGDPVFGKLDAAFAAALMSIGAVKAVEVGDGIQSAKNTGAENNDAFLMRDGHVGKASNHAGGILGGISDGSEIILRAHIKPTPSIGKAQKTVNSAGEETSLLIQGRHDPVIVPRAVVVIEAMAALVLADALLFGMSASMENVLRVYKAESPASLRSPSDPL